MKFWRSRTTLALVLTVAALVVPCAAWYIVGSREVRRGTLQIEAGPRRFASDTALSWRGVCKSGSTHCSKRNQIVSDSLGTATLCRRPAFHSTST